MHRQTGLQLACANLHFHQWWMRCPFMYAPARWCHFCMGFFIPGLYHGEESKHCPGPPSLYLPGSEQTLVTWTKLMWEHWQWEWVGCAGTQKREGGLGAVPWASDCPMGVLAMEPSGMGTWALFWADGLGQWSARDESGCNSSLGWGWNKGRHHQLLAPGAVTKANIWRLGLPSFLLEISRLSETGINLKKFTSRVCGR